MIVFVFKSLWLRKPWRTFVTTHTYCNFNLTPTNYFPPRSGYILCHCSNDLFTLNANNANNRQGKWLNIGILRDGINTMFSILLHQLLSARNNDMTNCIESKPVLQNKHKPSSLILKWYSGELLPCKSEWSDSNFKESKIEYRLYQKMIKHCIMRVQ